MPTIPSIVCRWALCLNLAAMAMAAAGAAAQALPPSAQDIPQLEALARSEALRTLPPLTGQQRLAVGPIPPRLQLAPCANISSAPAPGAHDRNRVLVQLRCSSGAGPPLWHLYVPVRVIGTSPVAVAAHALIAGSVLTATDVRIEQQDLARLPPGYLDDAGIAVGLTVARAIAGGAVLTNQLLLGSKVVQRGQTVTLIASGGGVSVRMAGRAMNDGLVNQRVRVENLSSGKIVEGIARSEQVVEIIFQ
jgi:flagella basal body P-ring formation protein FlgA